jgi:hypothetical protein
MAALGDFDDKNVKMFIDNGVKRISAWSKLLAFADQENHAIYDARTSVALNCALRQLGDSRRFYMPDGQNDLIKEARLRLRRLGTESGELTQPVGYLNYIELLRAVVACRLAASVLAAEMVIYANAPNTAHQFLTCV